MAEHRYTLIGADKCGEFYERRSDDAADLLRERDRRGGRVMAGVRSEVWFVIDADRVDGAPDAGDHGYVEWCDGCSCCAVPALPGEESLCDGCQDERDNGEHRPPTADEVPA